MGAMVVILAMCIPLLAIFVKSDLGKALAHSISGQSDPGVLLQLDELHAEMEFLRQEHDLVRGELSAVHERLDFTERLLARADTDSATGMSS
jgi:hypothetical protein